jgi:hypothetical protein
MKSLFYEDLHLGDNMARLQLRHYARTVTDCGEKEEVAKSIECFDPGIC